MQQLRDVEKERAGYAVADINLNYAETEGLQAAVARICEEAAQAVRDGKTLIVLTDKNIREGFLPANSALVTGAVHHYLIQVGLRTDANILVETGFARDPHQFAVLLGFGATAIYPYLAYDVINDLLRKANYWVTQFMRKQTSVKGLRKVIKSSF
jgi:glutamate synthase (NADPH/NADH) large chain